MTKITIVYNNETEEVIECSDIGESPAFFIFFDDNGAPFRMIPFSNVGGVYIEYPEDEKEGLVIDFELDDRDMH